MSRLAVVLVHLSVAAIAVTGVVFFVMKYLMETDDPFALANHPWQPHVLVAHVIAAPLAVFALGWLWNAHIRPKAASGTRARRRSGLSGMWLIAPMILSGVLIQVATGEGFRAAMEWTHWITSGAFVVAYAIHQVLRARNGTATAPESTPSPPPEFP